jgi:2-amino-4-hydroxy-6-hydroxymethyldihydropteridine diphosphokinase
MNKAYLLIGGNLGDREANLAEARQRMESGCGRLMAASDLYATAGWGKQDQPDFLNQALWLETTLDPEALLQCLLSVERAMGRERSERYGPRTIDIDILFYGDSVLDLPHLQIPHPRIAERRFVLQPLAQIAGSYRHPVTGATIQEMLDQCNDPLHVHKYQGVVHKKP